PGARPRSARPPRPSGRRATSWPASSARASSARRTRRTRRSGPSTSTEIRRPAPAGAVDPPDLLGEILPGVSRSFALSLRVLPRSLRLPFGVTYLVARAADTIADTRALPPAQRRTAVEALRHALRDPAAAAPPVAERLGGAVSPAEGRLLAHLPGVERPVRGDDVPGTGPARWRCC